MSEYIYFGDDGDDGDDYIALDFKCLKGVNIYHPFDTYHTVRIPFDHWEDIKSAIDKQYAEYKKSQNKRQPIKQQTLDEFNNARQVAYGNNVQVEPLNNPETGEKARFVMRNGDDVVAIDDYVNDKYLYKK